MVLNSETYDQLRAAELEIALQQAKKEIEAGDFVVESVKNHIKRVTI